MVSKASRYCQLELGDYIRLARENEAARRRTLRVRSNLRALHRLWTDDGQRRRVGSYQEVGTDRSTFRCHFAMGKIRGTPCIRAGLIQDLRIHCAQKWELGKTLAISECKTLTMIDNVVHNLIYFHNVQMTKPTE